MNRLSFSNILDSVATLKFDFLKIKTKGFHRETSWVREIQLLDEGLCSLSAFLVFVCICTVTISVLIFSLQVTIYI